MSQSVISFYFFSLTFLFSCSCFAENHRYDSRYYEFALRENHPVGVMIVAYNRPHYFKEVIASIEKNPEASQLPFFFILDGGPGAKQEENARIIQHSTIVHKEIIRRTNNYGCAKNLIDAKRFMFDWCKFEKIIFMEDDLVITPQYLGLLIRLHQWAQEHYDNVGIVQAWTYCFLSPEEKKQRLQDVVDSGEHWWSFVSYCIDQATWNKISPILYEYEECFVDAIPQTPEFFIQRSRPASSDLAPLIRQWMKYLIQQRHIKPISNNRKFKFTPLDVAIFNSDAFDPNEDLMMGFALWMTGMVKIQTVVNRAQHIGKMGITIDENLWEIFQFDKITLEEFEEDQQLTHFREAN